MTPEKVGCVGSAFLYSKERATPIIRFAFSGSGLRSFVFFEYF